MPNEADGVSRLIGMHHRLLVYYTKIAIASKYATLVKVNYVISSTVDSLPVVEYR